MPFIKQDEKLKTPNFPLNEEFPWILKAKEGIDEMFQENIKGPYELLQKYKLYEYILNVDKKALVKELFGGEEKAPLDELRSRIKHYDTAYYEILNLSNDIVDYPLFRVMAQNMKQNLSHQAFKIREKLLESVLKYCNKSVMDIFNSYVEMRKQITSEPTNERELVALRAYIADAPNRIA